MDQRQIFLFNDGSFHTVLKEGTQYIRSTLNEEDNRIEVFFEDKEDFLNTEIRKKTSFYIVFCVRLIYFSCISECFQSNGQEIIWRLLMIHEARAWTP